MASVNKVIIVGNLGKDPETRYSPNGGAICNVRIATTRNWKDKTSGEKKEETEWHSVVFYDRLAEIAGEYVTKGSPLLIDGRLKLDTWEKDGKKNSKLRVVCDRMQLLGARSGEGGRSGGEGRSGDAPRGRGRPAGPGRSGPSGSPADEYDQSGGYDVGGDMSGRDMGASVESSGGEDDIPF